MLDLRAHFSTSLGADPARLHFTAHSHHPWPEVTRAAHLAAWEVAATRLSEKWQDVLGPVWQAAQRHVAGHLKLPDPTTLVFAPNTQELVVRLLSCLPTHRRPRILTTDGEFHSFARQVARLEEDGLLDVTRIPAEPGRDCLPRLAETARQGFDMIWVSEVFFTSGQALVGLETLAAAAGEAVLVLDGYHAFMARPVDLSGLAGRAFYLGGGYKYAMAGEGACFLHCPPGWLPRPRSTGWYAGGAASPIAYAEDGYRFMGSTFEPSGLYRLNAVMEWLAGLGVDAAAIHAHALALQARFVAGLPAGGLDPARLVVPLADPARGNFLAFDLDDAEGWKARLAAAGIVTDCRGRRLRFGFGLYHTAEEVDRLLDRLATA